MDSYWTILAESYWTDAVQLLYDKAMPTQPSQEATTAPITRYNFGVFTVRVDTGEVHIQCPMCPTKVMNGAGTESGLVANFKDHLADEHDSIGCKHCGEVLDVDGTGGWYHWDTGSIHCWQGKDFDASPETP